MLEDSPDDRLLTIFTEYVLVEFHEAGLSAIVHDDDALDHDNYSTDNNAVTPLMRGKDGHLLLLSERRRKR